MRLRSWSLCGIGLGVALSLVATTTAAGDWTDAGDEGLRMAVEQLVDERAIDIPVLSWPIADAELRRTLDAAEERGRLNPAQAAAVARVRRALDPPRREWFAAAGNPTDLRGFYDAPRESGEVGATLRWTGNPRYSGQLRLIATIDAQDGQSLRPDGSYLTARTGNWLWSAGWQDRWWGGGYEGSLQFSSNARPVFAMSFDRETSSPFETPWLRWLGPWTMGTFIGALEGKRSDSNNALLWGFRAAARPLPGFEFSITRNAQFCGDKPPCSLKAFWNVVSGNDNAGENVAASDEPGNQLATYEGRWGGHIGRLPLALYYQNTGETIDNKIPRPLRSLTLATISTWGDTTSGSRWRAHLEFSTTTCADFDDAQAADCAYENGIFTAGYRYRGRVLGHSTDSDSRQWALGMTISDVRDTVWTATIRRAEINRVGRTPSSTHTLAAGPQTWWVGEARHSRRLIGGTIDASLGLEHRRNDLTDDKSVEPVGYLRWTRAF